MNTVRRAVIDVGTNSIKLLVAHVSGRQVNPVREESKQTRLGQGFYDSHRLQPEAIVKTAEAVARFAGTARENGAQAIRVIATSAARDAINGNELAAAIKAASGLDIEIISGEQEANWVFQGVTSDPTLAGEPLLLVDLGGGSAEFIVGFARKKLFAESFALGTVRLLERCPHSDPPQPEELQRCRSFVTHFLQSTVKSAVQSALDRAKAESLDRPVRFIATGGTATILARMEGRLDDFDRARIEASSLSLERLGGHVQHLWTVPLRQRWNIVGLPKNRADVILTGAVIYQSVLEVFGLREMRVSTRGLRFAALMNA